MYSLYSVHRLKNFNAQHHIDNSNCNYCKIKNPKTIIYLSTITTCENYNKFEAKLCDFDDNYYDNTIIFMHRIFANVVIFNFWEIVSFTKHIENGLMKLYD